MLTENEKQISIDLDQFKLHLNIKQKIQLSLHFNTPSRKFYLSVIAFVVYEMMKIRDVKSIFLKMHHELIALLNETIGGFAGSSEMEKLISRIYKKWKSKLPDLEKAPLFRIVGRKKGYISGPERTYKCSENEKDSWANLFDYNGSGKNVRLLFSINALGVSLENCTLIYKDYVDGKAWEIFVADLEKVQEAETEGEKKSSEKIVTQLEPASVGQMAYPLPEKPSIAVLPFKNFSGDLEQDYLADGLTENIITGLAQIPEMFVIARNSSFTYKEKPVNVKQVSEELGVKYVLEGSVQKAGERLRVNAQLIDALKGHHLWAERYDRELKDLFKLQDEITVSILNAMHVKLITGEDAKLWRTGNLKAWSHLIKGRHYFYRWTPGENRKAREHFEQAVKIDPEYGFAWANLANTYTIDVMFGSSDSPEESINKASEILQKTSALWPAYYRHMIMKEIYQVQRQFEKAIVEGEAAVALDPNDPTALMFLAGGLNVVARPAEAIVYAEKAMRLEPYCPAAFLDWLAWMYDQAGHYKKALAIKEKLYDRALEGEYALGRSHLYLALAYARLNKMKKAREHMAEVRKTEPNYTIPIIKWFIRQVLTDEKYIDGIIEKFRKAGMPD